MRFIEPVLVKTRTKAVTIKKFEGTLIPLLTPCIFQRNDHLRRNEIKLYLTWSFKRKLINKKYTLNYFLKLLEHCPHCDNVLWKNWQFPFVSTPRKQFISVILILNCAPTWFVINHYLSVLRSISFFALSDVWFLCGCGPFLFISLSKLALLSKK